MFILLFIALYLLCGVATLLYLVHIIEDGGSTYGDVVANTLDDEIPGYTPGEYTACYYTVAIVILIAWPYILYKLFTNDLFE